MTLNGKVSIISLALAALASTLANADQVRLRSGKLIEGVIAETAAPGATGKIRLWLGPAQITLPAAEVASLTTDTLATNTLIDARYRFAGRSVDEGTQKLALALQQGAPPAAAAAILAQHGDAIAEAVPRLDMPAREALGQVLAAVEPLPEARTPQLAVRCLFLHAALGQSDQADAILKALGPDYFTRHPAEKQRLVDLLSRAVEGWSQAEDFASGQPAVQLLQRLDPRRAEGVAIQFYVQWGSVERRDRRYESALRIYARELFRVAPQIAGDRILKALDEAEKTIREKHHPKGAAPLYVTYGLPTVPDAARQRLARIWHDEGWACLWENHLADARAAFAQAVRYQKDCVAGCAATDLAQCEWRERRAALVPGDLKARFDLGVWCEEHELYSQAIVELREAMRSPELLSEADARIQTLQSKLAEAELSQIMNLYEKSDYGAVLSRIADFMRDKDHPQGFLAQAKQLKDMTEDALRMRVALRPQQAQALFGQAERAFYEEDYPRAKGLLDTITAHYADTVTFPRATALAALVNQKLLVADMESGRKPRADAAATSAALAGIHITTGTRSVVRNAIDDLPTSALQSLAVRRPASQPRRAPAPASANRATSASNSRASEANEIISQSIKKLTQ